MAADRLKLGSALRYFGDGWQISKKLGGRHFWRIPVMDGEFLCEATTGLTKQAVGGGNLLLLAESSAKALAAAEAAVEAMAKVRGAIMPFPGGIVRSGSKIGGKYKGMIASTNDAFAPTLRGVVKSELGPDVNAVLEIVIDGETSDAVAAAMKAGIKAVADLGPEQGRDAHQRRQLRRQARQVPLSSEGPAAVKALTFTLVAEPPERLDLSPLTPQGLAGLDRRAIEKIRLGQSKRASVGRRHFPRRGQRRAEPSSSTAAAAGSTAWRPD